MAARLSRGAEGERGHMNTGRGSHCGCLKTVISHTHTQKHVCKLDILSWKD